MPRLHTGVPVRRLRLGILNRLTYMPLTRFYHSITYKDAVVRVCCSELGAVAAELARQRRILEDYIAVHPAFAGAMEPLKLLPEAPTVAQRMARAAGLAGVGPMAAVAGAMAQLAAEAGLLAGAQEAIVENGGDIFLAAVAPVLIEINTGATPVGNRLAFHVQPKDTPLAICSSSGIMGPSYSHGRCDLATVVSEDAALADAAATKAGNLVASVDDVDAALERIMRIPGIRGVLIFKDDRIGLAGRLPELIRRAAPDGV